MQLDVMRLFCDVAREGSVSGAARLHGVTQSAASQRIMALERELGVRLVDRARRPLRLTVAGELYRQGSEEILERYEQVKRQIVGPGRALCDTVRVAAIYSAGIDLLNLAQERFEAEHPEVRVRVDYLQPALVHARVRDQQVDFGILSYPRQWRGLTAQPLREETMVVVCAAGHPLAQRSMLSPAQLVGQSLVSFDSSLPIANHISAYLRRNGGDPELSHSFDNIDTIKTFVAQSDEVAILPRRTVQQEVAEGELAAIALAPALTRPVAIVLSPQRPLSAAARALIGKITAVGAAGANAAPVALAV